MRRLIIFAAAIAILASCTGRKVYDHYDHTPLSGWDKVDELTYDVPAVKDSGLYATTLGLRINEAYPFQALTLIIQQKVIHKPVKGNNKKANKVNAQTFTDTLNFSLFDDNGVIKGSGISYYQYHYRVSEMDLQAGDSLHITVTHDMRREIIPGISDIGIAVATSRPSFRQ